MERIITILALSFLVFSCGNDTEKKETSTTTNPTTTSSTEASHDGHDHAGHHHDHGESNHHKASHLSPYIGIWDYFASTHNNEYYKDRWIELKGDGTFENGVGGKQTNKGKWTFHADTKILDLDFKDNTVEKDEQWKTQANRPVLILLGNTPKNKTGAQIKLDLVDQRPDKS